MESQQALRLAELDYEQQDRALRVALVSAEARYAAALAGLEARRLALDAAEQALALVDERYRAGLGSLEGW